MITTVKCGVISAYMTSATGLISDTWQVVRPRTERRGEFLRQSYTCVGKQKKEKAQKKRCQKRGARRNFQGGHPSSY